MKEKLCKNFHLLVSLTANELNFNTPAAIEKDYYITHAIYALSQINSDYFQLVFQGGTCLAKAHQLIQRMSEDCDFRMMAKPTALKLTKTAHRNELRKFRHQLISALRSQGFVFEDEMIHARNGGEFMSIRIPYTSLYEKAISLRSYIALDFFLNAVKTPTILLPVTTLIRQTLGEGEEVEHPIVDIYCLSITETAAEKWVALTRRIATLEYRQNYRDSTLIRHLYDLHQIKDKYFSKQLPTLVTQIVMMDRQQFKNHNPAYYENPAKESAKALKLLKGNPIWETYWQNFMSDMVFQKDKPVYKTALKKLIQRSKPILVAIQSHLNQ